MSEDPFRPLVHFTAPTGWLNDPNGLVYFEGEYHLFYQYLTPRGWGHAVSTDLIHWTHLPVALRPDRLGAIFSGSVVVDWHDSSGFFDGQPGLVAIFTHDNESDPPDGPQVQSLACSADRGRTWTTYAHNPVIPNPGVADFRDPKVFWHDATRRWVMVVAFNRNSVRFYTSPNLRDWTWTGVFGPGEGAQEGTWECPDLFVLPVEGEAVRQHWILHVSSLQKQLGPRRHNMQYFLGYFDGVAFINENPPHLTLWSDYGRDNYAAVSWSDVPVSDGRRIWIGWMSNWIYAHAVPTGEWQGAMTLPRQVRLVRQPDGIRLIQRPVAELRRLRGTELRFDDERVAPDRALHIANTGEVFEVELEVDMGTAAACGVRIHHGADHYTAVTYDVTSSCLIVDRAHAGHTAFHPAFDAPQEGLLPLTETLRLHLFVDRSSLEVFADEGTVVLTSLFFPAAPTNALEVYALGGDVQVRRLSVYPLSLTQGTVAADSNEAVRTLA